MLAAAAVTALTTMVATFVIVSGASGSGSTNNASSSGMPPPPQQAGGSGGGRIATYEAVDGFCSPAHRDSLAAEQRNLEAEISQTVSQSVSARPSSHHQCYAIIRHPRSPIQHFFCLLKITNSEYKIVEF